MDKNFINENIVKNVLLDVLSEEISKVKRDDFNRVQYKIEELENSLKETLKELSKLESCVPEGLKTVCSNRVVAISNNLKSTEKIIHVLKKKLKNYKREIYSKQIEEKKK